MEELIYVNVLGKNGDGDYVYEFYFSDGESDIAFGLDWEIKPSCVCRLQVPDKKNYDTIRILKTNLKLVPGQDNSCFSYQDVKDKVVSVLHECLDEVEEYPENGRIVFHYADTIDKIQEKLAKRDLAFERE